MAVVNMVNINIAVTPVGKSITNGVTFAFTGTPSGVVSSDGKIDLSKDYPAGTAVTLNFALTTQSLSFTAAPNIGTFPLSFFSGTNGAKDACWIALNGTNPGIYSGTEFIFGPNALGSGNTSLTISDGNNDGNLYVYALWFFVTIPGTPGQKFERDPRIINHSTNR